MILNRFLFGIPVTVCKFAAIMCNVPSIVNGYSMKTFTKYSEVLNYSCNDGFVKSAIPICEANGVLSATPTCESKWKQPYSAYIPSYFKLLLFP